jgi:hypothetical protein
MDWPMSISQRPKNSSSSASVISATERTLIRQKNNHRAASRASTISLFRKIEHRVQAHPAFPPQRRPFFSGTLARSQSQSMMIPRHSRAARVPPAGSGRDAGDFARQCFTMRNHIVEILFDLWRRSTCLEPTGLRCCYAIVRGRVL